MNKNDAIRYIEGISTVFCKPGTERVEELCALLGHPERMLNVIHVTGTNGKGSFCAMLESILRAAGYKTGLFTSPAILSLTEQIRVAGESISEEALATVTEEARACVADMKEPPSSFELLTAIALAHFRKEACEVVILETGLGARLDATNVIDAPLLSVVTGVAIDHSAFLGDTVEAIALEKAGVIKPSCPVLYGGTDDVARRVLLREAERLGAPFYEVTDKPTHTRATEEGTHFDLGERRDLFLPLLGLYQPKNAARAVRAAELLRTRGLSVSEEAIVRGLSTVRWRGRFERLSSDPPTFFDGAHNPDGVREAMESLVHYFGKTGIYLLSGVLADKDHREMGRMLSRVVRRAFTVTPPSPRAMDAVAYARELSECGIPAVAYESVSSALLAAREAAKRDGVPLVCLGSLYLYASVLSLL